MINPSRLLLYSSIVLFFGIPINLLASSSVNEVTTTSDTGAGSLREAINYATSGDTISFASSINGLEIQLSSQIVVTGKDLVLQGNGKFATIIDGTNSNQRLFSFYNGSTILLMDLTLKNGGGPSFNGLGGGMAIDASDVTLIDCYITENETASTSGGGAIYIQRGSCVAVNCIFRSNKCLAGNGGVAWLNPKTVFIVDQCLFESNEVSNQGACVVVLDSSNCRISQSTLTMNMSLNTASVIFEQNGATTELFNNIIHGNNGAEAMVQAGTPTTLIAMHNLVDVLGTIPEGVDGNFISNPGFVDPTNEDFRLQSGSAAVDAGDDSLIPLDIFDINQNSNVTESLPFDLDGNTRIKRCRVDLGAFENIEVDFCTARNDFCRRAIDLPIIVPTCTMVYADTDSATASGINSNCETDGTHRDLWYRFIAPTNGNILVEYQSISSGPFPILSIWDNCDGIQGQEITAFKMSEDSMYIIDLESESSYYLSISSRTGSENNFEFCIKLGPDTPSNDFCTGAISLPVFTSSCTYTQANTSIASYSDVSNSCFTSDVRDLWYTFIAPSTNSVRFNYFSNSTVLPYFDIWRSCTGSSADEFVCNGNLRHDEVIPGLQIGFTYYLRIYSKNSCNYRHGTFQFCLNEGPLPPSNDECVTATVLSPITQNCQVVTGNTIIARRSGVQNSCSSDYTYDLWYEFQAPSSGKVVLQYFDLTAMPSTSVWSNCGGSPSYEVYCSASLQTYHFFYDLTPNHIYFLSMASQQSNRGTFEFCLYEAQDPPLNDICDQAIPISCGNIVIGDVLYATNSDYIGLCPSGTENGAGIWYTFDGMGDTIIISTDLSGTDFDTELEVYVGTCGSLSCVASDDNGGTGLKAEVRFSSQLNETYYVYVDGHLSARGNFELSLDCLNGCPTLRNISGIPPSGTYLADISINSDAIIEPTKHVVYKAGGNIQLSNDFEVRLGAQFDLLIEPCVEIFE